MTPSAPLVLTFVALCLLLGVLPFIPAFREWRRPTDDAALRVLPDYNNDIDHFARRLRADADAALGRGPGTGHEVFDRVAAPVQAMDWDGAGRRLLATEAIATHAPIRTRHPLYVDGSLRAGGASAFTAVFAAGDLALGAGSEISDWAHAERTITIGPDSALQRRASAGSAIHLGAGSRFERLQAAEVVFGDAGPPPVPPGGQQPGSYADVPDVVRQTDALYLVRGDCSLPAGRAYQGSLIVKGHLTVGAGTTIAGDVKARDGLRLAAGAAVEGAVTCEARVHLSPGCFVLGPLVTEGDMLLESGTRVGRPGQPTTVSARNIVADAGVVLHGSVWAHELGSVRAR